MAEDAAGVDMIGYSCFAATAGEKPSRPASERRCPVSIVV
jgi:hypothetical protein